MAAKKLKDYISELQKLQQLYDPKSSKQKKELLQQISKHTLTSKKEINEYHDLLLFMRGYPDDSELFKLVIAEFQRLSISLRTLNEKGKSDSLLNSGLPFTTIEASFGYDLVCWLYERFPLEVSLLSIDASPDLVDHIFSALLPESVRNERDNRKILPTNKMLIKFAGKNPANHLPWLLNLFKNSDLNHEFKNFHFAELTVYIRFNIGEDFFTMLDEATGANTIFYHDKGLLKKPDPQKVLFDKNIREVKLSLKNKEEVVERAKSTLFTLLRETDPVTNSIAEATELFDLGRGLKAGLFTLKHNSRLSIESYVGYLAFKNNVPITYGGSWITGNHARIGVNIFPWFRGGESSLTFLQIIRLYHHSFGIRSFSVEPYQIGKDNSDGIRSGAFWFYYKLGFRPEQKNLAELANSEVAKMSKVKGYRSTSDILRKLADSIMVLRLNQNEDVLLDSSVITLKMIDFVQQKYNGDFQKAESDCLKQLSTTLNIKKSDYKNPAIKNAVRKLCIFICSVEELPKASLPDRNFLKKLVLSKGELKERNFIRLWIGNRLWTKRLEDIFR